MQQYLIDAWFAACTFAAFLVIACMVRYHDGRMTSRTELWADIKEDL